MSEKRLSNIIMAIQKYVNKYNNADFINYYDLFSIDRNLSSSKISSYLKENKYKACFHPDNLGSIPEVYQEYYLEVVRLYTLFEDIVTDTRKKDEYDRKLNDVLREENKQKNNKEEKKVEKEKIFIYNYFSKYVLPNVYKYGLDYTKRLLNYYMIDNEFNLGKFTRSGGSREAFLIR